MTEKTTISYYNDNADAFFNRTISANIGRFYQDFLGHLSAGSHILDLGCGSGRDSKYFLDQGYQVTACDASQEMVKLASNHMGQEAFLLKFQDLDFEQSFEAVWANASLLHVPYDNLESILKKIHRALKPEGVFYASFKHGDHHRNDGARDFYDMNEKKIKPYLAPLFENLCFTVSEDTRSQVAASPLKQWFNILVRKK